MRARGRGVYGPAMTSHGRAMGRSKYASRSMMPVLTSITMTTWSATWSDRGSSAPLWCIDSLFCMLKVDNFTRLPQFAASSYGRE